MAQKASSLCQATFGQEETDLYSSKEVVCLLVCYPWVLIRSQHGVPFFERHEDVSIRAVSMVEKPCGHLLTDLRKEAAIRPHHMNETVIEQRAKVSRDTVLTHESAKTYMNCLGVWMVEDLDKHVVQSLAAPIATVAKILVQAFDGTSRIAAQHHQSNATVDDDMPPVLTYQILKMNMRQLMKLPQRN